MPPESIKHKARLLKDCQCWIFDMDGTLTNAIHDFDDIRRQLGLPRDKPILESISALPAAEAANVAQRLDHLELELAGHATAQDGAQVLLETLQGRGRQLGILTRNGKQIARETLAACGLKDFFADDDIISRDCCTPKPDPAGVRNLLSKWQADPDSTVMVGDYLFDLQAGSRAGTLTVHLAVDGQFHWPEHTTAGIRSLQELSALL